jgi:hypothetical protein
MDKDLYEALQEAAQRKHGNLSVLSPKSESVEDRKAFDRLVLALHKLRELGFVKFGDKQVLTDNMNNDYSYLGIACELTYDGEKALSYGSYDAYLKSLPTTQHLGINVDQSFKNYGSINGANIAVHSKQVNQTLGKYPEIEKLFHQIIETLQQDATLTQTKLQDLIDDAQSLKKELQRVSPRPGILTELYSFFGNTASISGYLPQLRELIQPFLS